MQSARNNNQARNLQNNRSANVNHHQQQQQQQQQQHHPHQYPQHANKSHYPPIPTTVQNQPLYGNILNNCNNGKSNSVASYNSRQSAGQISIGSQSSSTSSIPASNVTEIDSNAYRNPLTIRRESASSFSTGAQSNRVSPSVCSMKLHLYLF